MKILSDTRVLDLGSFITAPHAAMLLAELGADVIKVERPGSGDPFRWFNEGLSSIAFQTHNRNKRSLALDFTKPQGLELLYALVKTADVLLINVRPGVEQKLRIGPADLHAVNPRLIYCSITGFGADGPYAKRPAYDTVGQTMSGWLSRFHQSDDPRIPGPALSDTVTGMFMCMGALAALHERERTGTGRTVEVNMIEAAMAFGIDPLMYYLRTGTEQPFYLRGSNSQAYILRCLDGKRVSLHMSTPDKFWLNLTQAIERPDLAERYPDRIARSEHYEEIARELAAVFAARSRVDWMVRLEAHDVPFAPEHAFADLQDDPQIRHLGAFNTMEHPEFGTLRGVNRPLRFDGDNRSDFLHTPRLGEHTDAVLGDLGLSAERIGELRDAGIVQGKH